MKIVVVRIRGSIKMNTAIKDTLDMLRLHRKNHCIIIEDIPTNKGMIKKVKDYVTYGEVDEETSKLLFEKGEEYTEKSTDRKGKIKYNKFMIYNGKKIKKYFRLQPPKKGYGRKGIKKDFVNGGALGYRGREINNLLKRMF